MARRPGRRPKEPTPGTKASLGLTVTAELKSRLDAEAARTGRTQSQEAQWRLEKSFDRQNLLNEVLTLAYGPRSAALLAVLGDALGVIERGLEQDHGGQENFTTPRGYTAAMIATGVILDELNPTGDGFPAAKPRLADIKWDNIGHYVAANTLRMLRLDPDPHWRALRASLGDLLKNPSLPKSPSKREPK